MTKQKQKSRQDQYEIFLNLQHYFAAGALTNIAFLSSAAPSFSKNISIFGSGSKNDKNDSIISQLKIFMNVKDTLGLETFNPLGL